MPKEVSWSKSPLFYPRFGVELLAEVNPGLFAEEVERHAVDIIGPITETEQKSTKKIVIHELRVNRVFEELWIEVVPRPKACKPSKRSREAGGSGRGKRRKIESTISKVVALKKEASQFGMVLEAAKAKLKTCSLKAQKRKEKLGQSSSSEVARSSVRTVFKVTPCATKSELEAANALAGMKLKKSSRNPASPELSMMTMMSK